MHEVRKFAFMIKALYDVQSVLIGGICEAEVAMK